MPGWWFGTFGLFFHILGMTPSFFRGVGQPPTRHAVCNMGVSENSVSLNPMVFMIIIPMKNGYFIGKINPTFSDKPT